MRSESFDTKSFTLSFEGPALRGELPSFFIFKLESARKL